MNPGVTALVVLAAFLHASWNAVLRSGKDRLWTGTAISFSAALGCLAAIPFLPGPARASWFCLGTSAVIHIAYQLLLIRMYRLGEFGLTYPVARGSSPLFICVGAVLLTREYLSPLHLLGVLLISAGILSLALGAHPLHRQSIPPALLTGVSISVYTLIDGIGGRLAGSAPGYTAWMMLFTGLSMPLVAWAVRRRPGKGWRSQHFSRRELAQAFGGGLVSVTAYGIVIWAMQRSPMGIVSALRETSVLFAAVLGRVVLKEPFTGRKVAAAVLICTGVICLH